MLAFLLSPAIVPFSIALGLLAGLLSLEIAALFMGGSVFGKSIDEGDIDAGGGFDKAGTAAGLLDVPAELDISQIDMGDIDIGDLDLGDVDLVEIGHPAPAIPTTGFSLPGFLGLGKVPFLIWLAALLAGFGLSGYGLQSIVLNTFGAPLPVLVAILPATFVGLWFARGYGNVLARLIPKTESSVYSKAMLNRRRGVVSQGTARRNTPAEVRVQDAYGNLHYIRAEPLDCKDTIAAGTDVLVLRVRLGSARGEFRIVALSRN